jgi:hypothetical protein
MVAFEGALGVIGSIFLGLGSSISDDLYSLELGMPLIPIVGFVAILSPQHKDVSAACVHLYLTGLWTPNC